MKIWRNFSLFTIGLISVIGSTVRADDREVEKTFSGVSYSEQEPKIPIGSKILLIGDSHVGGMSQRFRLYSRQMGYLPVVDGINGSKTNDLLKRLKEDIKIHSPKLIIIESGTNDSLCSQQWLDSHSDLYAKVAETAKINGAEVVWLSPPAISKQLRLHEQIKVRILSAVGEDSYFDLLSLGLQVTKDQIHLTRDGYEQLSEQLWNWLMEKNLVFGGC